MATIEYQVWERHEDGRERTAYDGTAEGAAIKAARAAIKAGNRAVIECYRPADGQTLYLNPRGYALNGIEWTPEGSELSWTR